MTVTVVIRRERLLYYFYVNQWFTSPWMISAPAVRECHSRRGGRVDAQRRTEWLFRQRTEGFVRRDARGASGWWDLLRVGFRSVILTYPVESYRGLVCRFLRPGPSPVRSSPLWVLKRIFSVLRNIWKCSDTDATSNLCRESRSQGNRSTCHNSRRAP